MLFAAYTSPEFYTFSTIECGAISSSLAHSGTRAAKLARRSEPMTPNTSFRGRCATKPRSTPAEARMKEIKRANT